MNVIAVLSYFDESPTWLSQCVAGIGRFASHLVAVDGPYMLYPSDGRPRSPLEQTEAIVGTAEAAGLSLTLHTPPHPWAGNEVGKRNHTLKLARTVSDSTDDWIVIIDADEVVRYVSPFFHRDLANAADHAVCEYRLENSFDVFGAEAAELLAQNVALEQRSGQSVRSIYRNLPDLEYVGRHFWVRATVDGEKQWLWGDQVAHEMLPAADLSRSLIVSHRNRFRTRLRKRAAAEYYELREEFEIEPVTSPVMETLDGSLRSLD